MRAEPSSTLGLNAMPLAARALGLAAALALALSCMVPSAHGQAPALGENAPRKGAKAAARPSPKHSTVRQSGLSLEDLANEAREYDNHSAYSSELGVLQELASRAKPDADLELWLALCQARTGDREEGVRPVRAEARALVLARAVELADGLNELTAPELPSSDARYERACPPMIVKPPPTYTVTVYGIADSAEIAIA